MTISIIRCLAELQRQSCGLKNPHPAFRLQYGYFSPTPRKAAVGNGISKPIVVDQAALLAGRFVQNRL